MTTVKEQDVVLCDCDEDGNPIILLPVTSAKNVEGLLDFVHPVGSVYYSANSVSPATLFGGVWASLSCEVIGDATIYKWQRTA